MARRLPFLILALWLALCGSGLGLLLWHGSGPGRGAAAPDRVPDAVAGAFGWRGDRPLLLLCAHPQCPCLPSTLAELQRVLAAAPAAAVGVLVLEPAVRPADWDPDAAAAIAAALPQATRLADRDGALSRQLGASTSGQLLLYGRDGRLRFAGGATGGRGHRGDNPAARALAAQLAGADRPAASRPTEKAVFGCPLFADSPDDHGTACCQPD